MPVAKNILTMSSLIAMAAIALLLLLPCCTSGTSDYGVDLGGGYILFYPNSIGVSILKIGPSGETTFQCPVTDNSGPIAKYVTTPKHIFAIKYGLNWTDSNSPKIDSTRQTYYIIVKETGEIIGPLNDVDFYDRPEVKSIGALEWETAREDFWRALLLSIIFLPGLFLLIPILAIKYFWLTIPVATAVYFFIKRQKRLKGSHTNEPSN